MFATPLSTLPHSLSDEHCYPYYYDYSDKVLCTALPPVGAASEDRESLGRNRGWGTVESGSPVGEGCCGDLLCR